MECDFDEQCVRAFVNKDLEQVFEFLSSLQSTENIVRLLYIIYDVDEYLSTTQQYVFSNLVFKKEFDMAFTFAMQKLQLVKIIVSEK